MPEYPMANQPVKLLFIMKGIAAYKAVAIPDTRLFNRIIPQYRLNLAAQCLSETRFQTGIIQYEPR
ncbi:hypothetical protein HMPREF9370_0956 [Neisseria wadsworthii 9715]|uniref:Uncharacterized protein n=1 Tax=Neisseria wadsworthii 9715 TaxID=1030841 RepID=G4CPE6_9NEIS|nr:hypothetical protein HMPREF9370_0956 [Neisseria wadsworthii 9715]